MGVFAPCKLRCGLQRVDDVVHIVKAGAATAHKVGGAHSARGKHLAGGGAVGKRDHLILAGKQHVVLAHNGAAAYGVQADLAPLALAALGVTVVYVGMLALLCLLDRKSVV